MLELTLVLSPLKNYDKKQKLVHQFVEEFVLSLRPRKKLLRYRTLRRQVVPKLGIKFSDKNLS